MKKRFLLILTLTVAMAMSMVVLAGCGGSDSGDTEEPAAEDQTADTEFLLGSWFAETATYEGEEKDPDEVFGGIFQLYFSDNGECTMSIDQKRAVVNWEYTGDGVTLTGDDTYEITFPDDSKEKLIINVKGIDVLMEKYQE